ncbi:MAG TPA: ATP-binding protein [Chloroflexota bacterium]|nr:ATP-binding protein [Chloroflexota bacterium]
MFTLARWRLVAWNVAILVIILAILEILVYAVFRQQIYRGVDSDLKQRRQQAIQTIATQGIGVELAVAARDDGYHTVILTPDGELYSGECVQEKTIDPSIMTCPPGTTTSFQPAMHQVAQTGGSDVRTVTYQSHPQRIITFMARTGPTPYIVQIGRTAAGEVEAEHTLTLLLILGGFFGVVLSGLGSLFLASRALIPIRQAFSRQRQFTADASHELRTPLALIRANAEMLARRADQLPEGDEELVHEIIQETDHLNRLVGDLLTLARADTGGVKIEPRPVDLRALVEAVHEDIQPIAEARGIHSEVELNGPVRVMGDEGRLRQLLLILLDNALKYTDPGGRVEIALNKHDHHAHLSVTDTGIGIPRSDLTHVFDRFYRVDRAREHESGGTGLGLSIAQWICQAHSGSIEVESEVGRGSRFEISLPAR